MTQKMFPLQTDRHSKPGPTRIQWSIAEKAYRAYAARYGKSQSLEELARRGGFGWCEMEGNLHCVLNAINPLLFCASTTQKQTPERPHSMATENNGEPKEVNVEAKEPVTVYDETRNANVCNLCGSADIQSGYGLAGGGGIGMYNFCNGCQRVLDKSTDPEFADE